MELLCREAPGAIEDLVRWGAQFAREGDGRLSQRFFGAHRYRRTCFAGDYTGLEIQRTLVRRAEEVGVSIRDDVYITRLLVHDGRVFGCYGFGVDDGTSLGDPRRRGDPRGGRAHADLAALVVAA